MRKISILVFVIMFPFAAIAQQEMEAYVTQHAAGIKSIHPDSLYYIDFESIGNAIGNSRIVMLGEQDHGDGTTFKAKTSLVKYLHEQKGFNVLAFEADFFGLNSGWDNLDKSGNNVYDFLRKNLTSVWSYCDACEYLLKELIPKSYASLHPIIVSGVDNQMALNYSVKNLTKKLDSVFRELNLPVTRDAAYTKTVLPIIDSLTKFLFVKQDAGFYDDAVIKLQQVRSEINSAGKRDSFEGIVVDNLIQVATQFKYFTNDIDRARNARDIQMARNLKWLCEVKYPDEKIIVWAQNFHVSKFSGHYSKRIFNDLVSMGTEFTRDSVYDKATYVIGFTSYAGVTGWAGQKPYDVETLTKNSFENWINPSYEYGFVDFREFNKQTSPRKIEFNMNGSVVDKLHKKYHAQWTRIFDGVFYIRNMHPCKLAL